MKNFTVKENYFVKDKAIHCSQGANKNGAMLLSDDKYKHFELTVEIKSDWGCDSGVYLRAGETGKGVQILNDYLKKGSIGFPYIKPIQRPIYFIEKEGVPVAENIPKTSGAKTFTYSIDAEAWNKVWKKGDWNQLKIRIIGDKPVITTWINGTKVVEYREIKPKKSGYIGLQVHPGSRWKSGGYARYRNISIKKLTP